MVEQGFPSMHTTATSATHDTNLRFDPSYVRTLAGMLKVSQAVLDLLGFACVESSPHSGAGTGVWFDAVAMGAFWFTGIALALYLFHAPERFHRVPWARVELCFCALWTPLYLVASCLAATYGLPAFAAASFFGFCATVTYGYDGFLKWSSLRRGALDQGVKVVSKETAGPADA